MSTNKETINPTSSLLVRELERVSSERLPIYFEIVEALENLDRHQEIFPRLSHLLGVNAFRVSREVSLYSRGIKENRKISPPSKRLEFKQAGYVLQLINSLATPQTELKDPLLAAEEKITRASFMGALYCLAAKNGLFDSLWDIMTRFDAKKDFRQIIESDLNVAWAIDNLIDKTVEDLQIISSPEATSVNQLNHLVSCLSDEVETEIWKSFKGGTTDNEQILKKQKERRGLIAHLVAVGLIVAGVGVGTMHLVKRGEENKPITVISTDSLPPILKPIPLSTSPLSPTPEPERKPTPTVAATETETIPIPKQITVDKDKGGKVAAPEVSIEMNEAFYVVEKGDSLSQITKKYWDNGEMSMQDLIHLTRALLMINPHLGNDPNKIKVGKRVFIYPDQMKGKFAEVLAATIDVAERKATEKEFQALIEKLSIPVIDKVKDLATAKDNGNWLLFRNDKGITIEDLLEICYGNSDEMTLTLINRINQMKVLNKDIVDGLIILPTKGWVIFESANCLLPPAIPIPKITADQTTSKKETEKPATTAKEVLDFFLGIPYKESGYRNDEGMWCTFDGININADNIKGLNCAGLVIEGYRHLFGKVGLKQVAVKRNDPPTRPAEDKEWLWYGYDLVMNLAAIGKGKIFKVDGLDWQEGAGFLVSQWERLSTALTAGKIYFVSVNKPDNAVGYRHHHVAIIIPNGKDILVYESNRTNGVQVISLKELQKKYAEADSAYRMFVVEFGLPSSPQFVRPTFLAAENPKQVAEIYYVVKKGDTLSAIARRYGTTVQAITQANSLANPNFIRDGQRLRILGKGEVKGVYKELPMELEKYLGGYWATWEEIPEKLRQWLTGIIAEETSTQRVPSWAVLSIMSAEQLGGFRLTSRSSTASAVEPLGITPGWELTYFNTKQERFDFRKQVAMVAERLVANGLSVDALSKEGEAAYRKKLETYLCKHLAGEDHDCGPESKDRTIAASPGSTMKVQGYVEIGSKTATDLTQTETLQKDTIEVIIDKVVAETDKKLGVTPPEEEAKAAVDNKDPQAVVSGEKRLVIAVKEAVDKKVEQAKASIEKEVNKIIRGDSPIESASVEPTKADAPAKPNVINLSKEDLLSVQTEAQKSLCRPVTPQEVAAALQNNNYDPQKAIGSFKFSPEATICQYCKDSWKKIKGQEPLTDQARVIADEAMKVWNGQDPQTLNYTQIEAAKKRVEEILGANKKVSKISLVERFGGNNGVVAENIRMAVVKLPEGKISLAPGQTFDFNKIFGPYVAPYKALNGLIAAGVCDLASLVYDGLTVKADPKLMPARTSIHGKPIPGITQDNTVSILTDANGNSIQNLIVTNNTERTITFNFEIKGEELQFWVN